MEECCKKTEEQSAGGKKDKGLLKGILYGIMPHTFCILFVVFTILGTTIITSILKPFLLNPYFFYILMGLSFFLATVSALIYLKRNKLFSVRGAKRSWKYLLILYGTTIAVNLILFLVVFPMAANFRSSSVLSSSFENQIGETEKLTLAVDIPCSGHASLITDEIKKIEGIKSVNFRLPNLFDVTFNQDRTTKEKILSLEIFSTYKAEIK